MSFKDLLLACLAINLIGALGTVVVFLGSGSVFRALLVGSLFYLGLIGICLRYFLSIRSGPSAE